MPSLDPLAEYQNIRDEIRSEHNLISSRLNWYVTAQSFLIIAFAIAEGTAFTWFVWFSRALLPVTGLLCSVLIFPSVAAACATLELWHAKQDTLLAKGPDLAAAFQLKRQSWLHKGSLLFPKLVPVLFGVFWLIVLVASFFVF